MTRRTDRGFAAGFLLAALALLLVIGAIVGTRHGIDRAASTDDDHRLQALTLARSAVLLRKSVARDVKLGDDTLRVDATGSGTKASATVKHPRWGTAKVDATFDAGGNALTWTETFDRPGPAAPPAPTAPGKPASPADELEIK